MYHKTTYSCCENGIGRCMDSSFEGVEISTHLEFMVFQRQATEAEFVLFCACR